MDIQLPYYFQVLGLGASPTETVVRPGTGGIGLKVGRQPGAEGWLQGSGGILVTTLFVFFGEVAIIPIPVDQSRA